MNNDRIKVLELLEAIQFMCSVHENLLKVKIGEEKAFTEGLIRAYKSVENMIFERFGLLKDEEVVN